MADDFQEASFDGVFDVAGYERLGRVLLAAYDQAARGKGANRHGKELPFDKQPMQNLLDLNGLGFGTGQAAKKAQEALRLDRDAATKELLGAINYLAGCVIKLERDAADGSEAQQLGLFTDSERQALNRMARGE